MPLEEVQPRNRQRELPWINEYISSGSKVINRKEFKDDTPIPNGTQFEDSSPMLFIEDLEVHNWYIHAID